MNQETEPTNGKTLELPEYVPKRLGPNDFPDELGSHIYENYDTEVAVEFPSPKTDGQWEFTNQGYAGRVQLPDGWTMLLEPKVSLTTLFGMMEYAYDLESARFLDGVYDADSIEGFFDRVASILSQNVIRRSNEGFHKEYIERAERSTFVRGKIDVQRTAQEPWSPEIHQQIRELTADIEDNQILLWTLREALSSGLHREDTRRNVRHAYRILEPVVSLREYTASDCTGREYRRLNSDYEFMHALCYLILDNSGPTRNLGRHQMVPFIVEMPTLYERFVARWLDAHLPSEYRAEAQKTARLDGATNLSFDIDLVLWRDSKAVAVADTKYKDAGKPSTDDVAQVVAYAERMETDEAILIYPTGLDTNVEFQIGDIRVRDLQFRLDGAIDRMGGDFMADLLAAVEP
jgi:5-methylcytosine-specific restriction enzyme subunit McrC